MNRRDRPRAPAALFFSLLLAAGCAGVGDAGRAAGLGPAGSALALFHLAQSPELSERELRAVVDPDALEEDPVGLLDALDPLRGAMHLRVVRTSHLVAVGRAAVDLKADAPGGRTVTWSVQVVPLPDGTWQVVWVGTPGRSWPSYPAAEPDLTVLPPDPGGH